MKVFISHSGHDKWVAGQISRLLEAEGHGTFLDEKDIKSGDSIDASIQTHLKDSDHLLLLLSPASISSHWVFIELGGAKALGKRVVPILLHVGANEIPSAIAQLLARDINELDKYIAEIRSTKGKLGLAAKADVKPPRSKKDKRPTKASLTVHRPASEFAAGDRVRVVQVERLTPADKLESPVWVDDMDKYSGISTRVKSVESNGWVRLQADGGMWRWLDDWLTRE